MTRESIDRLLKQGEGLEVEFKESFYELNKSTFESVCAFLNRKGGHLLLGVSNQGKVEGVLESEAEKMVDQLVTNANNPQKLSPAFYLSPQIIDYEAKKIIYVWVPESSQVHQTAGKIFDRTARDGDINITNHHQVAQLYLRKQNTYSENRIFPAVQLGDLRADLLQRVRVLAANQRPHHPWTGMTDEELMRSAGLYLKDVQTGQEGFTLAGVLLVGKDEVIQSALPHHKTDALVRIHNKDRYDDRDDIRTNLLESYDRLMAFVAKHLPDRFYLEGVQRISLRDRIFREVVANLLVHREFSNAFPAKLIIEEGRVLTENWNRPHGHGPINPALFTPFPKNPVIARFFKEIGWVDELGSGVRNTFKYAAIYSGGRNPVFEEGDVFRCIIPLNGTLSIEGKQVAKADRLSEVLNDLIDEGVNEGVIEGVNEGVRKELLIILQKIVERPGHGAVAITDSMSKAKSTVERYLKVLRSLRVVEFKGAPKTGGYFLTALMKERIERQS